ncbi:unnamed protein product [Closterium sp. NIES-65]|nr:unnamed protein product [Closterium sp. NIES-65]
MFSLVFGESNQLFLTPFRRLSLSPRRRAPSHSAIASLSILAGAPSKTTSLPLPPIPHCPSLLPSRRRCSLPSRRRLSFPLRRRLSLLPAVASPSLPAVASPSSPPSPLTPPRRRLSLLPAVASPPPRRRLSLLPAVASHSSPPSPLPPSRRRLSLLPAIASPSSLPSPLATEEEREGERVHGNASMLRLTRQAFLTLASGRGVQTLDARCPLPWTPA